MQTLRCGVCGLGRGRSFVEKLATLPGCEVVAACDPVEASHSGLGDIAGYTDFDVFLDQAHLDIVALIGPGPTHAPQTLKALEHGVSVISETPCVYTLNEAQAVADAVARTGLKYMLAEDYVWMGWVERWRELVEAGELGDIIAGHGEYVHDCRGMFLLNPEGGYLPWAERSARPETKPSWRATDLPPLKYCSHTLGPLLHLMRDHCTTACAQDSGSRVFPEAGTVDYASAVLQTEGGRVVTLTNGFGVAHPFIYIVGLYGTEGSIRGYSYDYGTIECKVYLDRNGGGWQDLPTPWSERTDGRDWVTVMLSEFVESVRSDTDPPIDFHRSMEYMLPGVCAHLSAEQDGRPIAVPSYR